MRTEICWQEYLYHGCKLEMYSSNTNWIWFQSLSLVTFWRNSNQFFLTSVNKYPYVVELRKLFLTSFVLKIQIYSFGCMHFTRDVYISLISIDLQTRRGARISSALLALSLRFQLHLTDHWRSCNNNYFGSRNKLDLSEDNCVGEFKSWPLEANILPWELISTCS